MKIQLVFFAVAGFVLSHASALGDGLNLNPKNLYDQISAQVRVPLRAETSAVRSVIDTMKDLQHKLQSDQLRSTYDASPLRNSQTHQQSYQERVSSGNNAPSNIRREELIQIREHQVVPSSHLAQQSGANPAFSGENQSLFNRNSQDIHRQVYQNKQQVEKFNQELSYITTQNPVQPQTTYTRQQEQRNAFNNPSAVSFQQSDNQQRYVFPQRSLEKKQETIVQRSFKQETVIPKQPYDGRQQPTSSKSLHQQDFNVQRSTNDGNQQDFNAQRFNNNQNQQDFNTQRFNNNQNQQDFNAQRFNNNNQNQQRQYQNEDKLSSRQLANNEGYRVAIPQQFQDSRPQIISYDLFNRNIELNGQRSYQASNQLNQAYVNRGSNNEPRKSSEGGQQQIRYEANKSNLSSENVFGQNNQNEKKVSAPVSEILNVASNIKGTVFNRQQLKTPFIVFNNGHLL